MPEVSWQPYTERRTDRSMRRSRLPDQDKENRGKETIMGEIRKEKVRIRSGAYLGVGLVLEGRGQRLGSA